jgi:CIC family chloride channel protein
MVGLVTADAMRVLASDRKEQPSKQAADIMQPPLSVRPEDDLRTATERLVANGLREIPVVDGTDAIIGFLDEREIAKVYLKGEARLDNSHTPPPART